MMSGAVKQPQNAVIKKGRLKVSLTFKADFSKTWNGKISKAQAFVDSECLRLMNPLTPRRTGYLIRSGTLGTTIGTGHIKYIAPYAKEQYYSNRGKGTRGKLWFERMKAQNKDYLRKGAAAYAKRK